MKMLKVNLFELFPPSPGCDCDICIGYCKRPGGGPWSRRNARSIRVMRIE